MASWLSNDISSKIYTDILETILKSLWVQSSHTYFPSVRWQCSRGTSGCSHPGVSWYICQWSREDEGTKKLLFPSSPQKVASSVPKQGPTLVKTNSIIFHIPILPNSGYHVLEKKKNLIFTEFSLFVPGFQKLASVVLAMFMDSCATLSVKVVLCDCHGDWKFMFPCLIQRNTELFPPIHFSTWCEVWIISIIRTISFLMAKSGECDHREAAN